MSDVHNATPPAETTTAEPLGNSTESRTPDGTLKNSTQPLIPPSEATTEKEGQTTDGKKEGATDSDKKEPATGAPEKYELKAPEGIELSADLIAEATPLFKELNLTNDQAQKLVDFYNKQTGSISEKLETMVAETRNGWREQIAKDKTLGNGVDNLSKDSSKAIADAISWAGDAKTQTALKSALDLTGAGDHPDIVRAFVAFGKKMGEATVVKGGGPAKTGQTAPGTQRSAAQALYPNLPSSANN